MFTFLFIYFHHNYAITIFSFHRLQIDLLLCVVMVSLFDGSCYFSGLVVLSWCAGW